MPTNAIGNPVDQMTARIGACFSLSPDSPIFVRPSIHRPIAEEVLDVLLQRLGKHEHLQVLVLLETALGIEAVTRQGTQLAAEIKEPLREGNDPVRATTSGMQVIVASDRYLKYLDNSDRSTGSAIDLWQAYGRRFSQELDSWYGWLVESQKFAIAHAGIDAIAELSREYCGTSAEWQKLVQQMREVVRALERISQQPQDVRDTSTASDLERSFVRVRKSLEDNALLANRQKVFGSEPPSLEKLNAYLATLMQRTDLMAEQKREIIQAINFWRKEFGCDLYYRNQRANLVFVPNTGKGKVVLRAPGRAQENLYSKASFPKLTVRKRRSISDE